MSHKFVKIYFKRKSDEAWQVVAFNNVTDKDFQVLSNRWADLIKTGKIVGLEIIAQ